MVAVLVALLVAMVLPVVAGPAPGAGAATDVTLPLTTYRAMTVAPDGRVFIAGDDEVLVYSAAGALVATIPDVWGAADMDVRDGDLYVASTTSGSIVQIDLSTLAVEATFVTGMVVARGGVVALPDAVWFLTSVSGSGRLARYDRAGATASVVSTVSSGQVRLTEIAGDDSAVLVNVSNSGGQVARVATASPFAVLGGFSANGYLADVAADGPTARAFTASGSPYNFPEWDLATMTATGRIFPGTYYPSAIDHVPALGGVIAGSTRGKVFVASTANPVSTHEIALPAQEVSGAVELAPDAMAVHAVIGSSPYRLYTVSLAPVLAATVPSTVVSGVPTTIVITGTGLGGSVAADIDGEPLTVVANTATRLELLAPTSLASGARVLTVTTPFGSSTRPLIVAENTGALLRGTVARGASGAGSIELTLSGGPLATPMTTTSASNGAYQFANVPYGDTYELTVHDPTGANPDFAVGPITLVPNETKVLDLDLATPPASGPVLARVGLPAGTVRDLVVEPVTGRVFVTVGDELVVYDADGRQLARRTGLTGAEDMTLGGGALFVSCETIASIVRFDPATLEETGRWPLGSTTNGAVAYAAGRLWFVKGNDQWTTVSSLDPATGSIVAHSGSVYVPRLRSVDGDPNLLLLSENLSSLKTVVYDVTSGSLVQIAQAQFSGGAPGPVAADATSGRLWSRDGREFRLSDMTETGYVYPVGGTVPALFGVESSPAHGGIVALGRNVVRRGTPAAAHTIDDTPAVRPGFAADGGRLYVASTSGDLVVVDLSPRITAPTGVFAEPQTLRLTGTGLGAATSARVDGVSVPVVAKTVGSVDLAVTSLDAGSHTVDVSTPWGTSSAVSFTATVRQPVPAVTSLSPSSVPTTGGVVVLTGSGFTGATSVRFGSTAVTSFTVDSDTQITATVPPKAASSGPVVVVGPGGTSPAGPTLTWVAPVPSVTSVSPSAGATIGGTPVTISGSGFSFATSVKFGTASASFTVVNDTTITATSPAGSGAVTVTVTTAGGTSVPSGGSTFSYSVSVPAVSNISPASGPASGATLVTIRGTAFTGATRVRFGSVEAAAFSVVDATTIVAVSPPGTGQAFVTVTTPGGTSANVLGSRFTYVSPSPGTIRGAVTSSAGALPGMVVVLSSPDTFTVLDTVTSDAGGRFDLAGVAPGQYRLLTLDPAIFAGASHYYVGEFYDDGGRTLDDFATSTPVAVAANGLTVLNPIVLDHNTPAAVSGVVRDTVGHELEGMEVVVSPAGSFEVSASVLTGPDGRFEVTGLAPGDYRVVTLDPAEAAGAPAHYVTEVYDDAGGLASFGTSAIVSLAAGGAAELDPIELAHTAPGSVSMTVTSTSGIPLQNMVVLVSNADEFVFAGANITAADGTITIGNLPPGDYKIGVFDARLIFGVPALYREEFLWDSPSFETAARIWVTAGTTTSLGTVTLAPVTP